MSLSGVTGNALKVDTIFEILRGSESAGVKPEVEKEGAAGVFEKEGSEAGGWTRAFAGVVASGVWKNELLEARF